MKNFIFIGLAITVFCSCSVQRKFAKVAEKHVLTESGLASAHIGISIFDADKQQFIYEHQGNKFFIPASNVKLLTCYAAMKHLGDSLLGAVFADNGEAIQMMPTADPTILHPDFKQQPIIDFIRKQSKPLFLSTRFWEEKPFGFGWAWDDYESDYMAERSIVPLYGNVVTITGRKDSLSMIPHSFEVEFKSDSGYITNISRARNRNVFYVDARGRQRRQLAIPFQTSDTLTVRLLSEATRRNIVLTRGIEWKPEVKIIQVHSQHTDSLLKPMMHRSDNFFAEQTLLMVSSKLLRNRAMNDARVIDTLLKSIYSDLPQKPKWVDGSGLSRYNLVSPEDFVFVLNKMNKEFEWKRIETILPTGGEGTLASFYKKYTGKIYAKTGTLSNNIALSGFLLTDSGKKLIFSVLVNNHQAPTATIRKGFENMLGWLIENY
jgi:D-alanyl-D-alanine carboxypeptidase/D-alanyl-D-alanine-endopeptidase (penicillin-binding protein 4)